MFFLFGSSQDTSGKMLWKFGKFHTWFSWDIVELNIVYFFVCLLFVCFYLNHLGIPTGRFPYSSSTSLLLISPSFPPPLPFFYFITFYPLVLNNNCTLFHQHRTELHTIFGIRTEWFFGYLLMIFVNSEGSKNLFYFFCFQQILIHDLTHKEHPQNKMFFFQEKFPNYNDKQLCLFWKDLF